LQAPPSARGGADRFVAMSVVRMKVTNVIRLFVEQSSAPILAAAVSV
jgi:hypothetical protein